MNSYTTLGEGKNTAILFSNADGTNRKVTTTDHDTARNLAQTLSRAVECMANALWDVALAYDGKPADARRRLLAAFDTKVAGTTPVLPDSCWDLAAQIVFRVADDVTGQPAAVIAAVRKELADGALVDCDGVLVGAVLWANAYKPGFLRLVMNPFMGPWKSGDRTVEPFFDGLDDEALALDSLGAEPPIPVDLGHYYTDDTWMILDLLREESSQHTDLYGEESARSIWASSGDEGPCLMLVPSHLRAWMSTHRPDLLEAYPRVGA